MAKFIIQNPLAMKQLLLDQYNGTYNQAHWFVPITRAVDGLTEEQANQQNAPGGHTIIELVNHLVFWNGRYLDRFNGIPFPKWDGINDSTFENPEHLNWEQCLQQMEQVFGSWQTAITQATEEKLNSPYNENSTHTWSAIICQLNTHNAYHIGQIVTLRKLQGSWDGKKGVS